MKKKWIFIVGMALLFGGGFWQWRRSAAVPSYETVEVVRGDIAETVSASATLVASEEIDLNFEITGRIKSIPIREGQTVAAGETLAVLEWTALQGEVAKAEASLAKAKADATANDDTLREAREGEKDAKSFYEAVENLEDQKVSAADLAYENAKDYEDDVESYYNQIVGDEGVGSLEAKTAKLTLTTAINARKAADEAKETARKNRESALRSAKNSWNATREKTKSLESSAIRSIETSALLTAEANLRTALANAEKAKILAPVNGKVTRVNFRVGEVIGSASASTFGKLLSSDFLLEAKVPESDIASVKMGQKARVSFDALDADESFEAEVIEIESDATVIQDVVYYVVQLRLSEIDRRLKPEMSADADIQIDERRGVLKLPSRLLREEDGKRLVSVLRNDMTREEREITIGLRGDEGGVEIRSGLSEGDRVISETKK